MKYIDKDECPGCDYYDKMYICMSHDCPIYQEYWIGRLEEGADFEHDKRRDERLIDPIFEQAIAPFRGK